MATVSKSDRWAEAVAHLRSADTRWVPVIDRVGPCQLRPTRDRFGILVKSIVSQQISSKAAQSILARLIEAAGGALEPERLLAFREPELRKLGLSSQKASYVHSLSNAVASGRVPLQTIGRWSDEAIVERLTEVKGIGVWTAEMFLVFALNRPDVLAVGDLGIRAGLKRHYGLAEVPAPRECHALAEPWRPYRSVAMWYLWRNIDMPVKPA